MAGSSERRRGRGGNLDVWPGYVDALSTLVTDGTLLKIYAWYDNEMGYACRMVDLACHMHDVGI